MLQLSFVCKKWIYRALTKKLCLLVQRIILAIIYLTQRYAVAILSEEGHHDPLQISMEEGYGIYKSA